jgi:hypothetical protein
MIVVVGAFNRVTGGIPHKLIDVINYPNFNDRNWENELVLTSSEIYLFLIIFFFQCIITPFRKKHNIQQYSKEHSNWQGIH